MTPSRGSLVWFRRDLRDRDHASLAAAITDEPPVWCAFVFDREILDALPSRSDRRVEFIRESLVELDAALRRRGGGMIVAHASAREAIPALAARLRVAAVYANRDHEPAAIARDAAVERQLAGLGIAFRTRKDHLIFERDEILTRAGTPYTVFTPYRRAWLAALAPAHLAAHDPDALGALAPPPPDLDLGIAPLAALGFRATDLAEIGVRPGMSGARARFAGFRRRVDDYAVARDYPSLDGSSGLSVHLRFGTVSVRELVAWAHARSLKPDGRGAAAWLSEMVWREFYAQILWHFPHVVDRAFRPACDAIAWPDPPGHLDAWREGRTGYPIVDAAMRQLARTGILHNRLRMITASFLAKDLHVDWRFGERHFADRLLDLELASNNGGWQWAASTGCDAQPYFRVFNPVAQSRRYDPQGEYIRRYLPELAALDAEQIHAPWIVAPAILSAKGVTLGRDYPTPIVDHASARRRTLELYGRSIAGARRASTPRALPGR